MKGSIGVSAQLITLLSHQQKLSEIVRLSLEGQKQSRFIDYSLAKGNLAFSGQRTKREGKVMDRAV